MNPIKHDTANEIAQPFDVKDWKKGECEPIPGKTMPNVFWSSVIIPTPIKNSPRWGRCSPNWAMAAKVSVLEYRG
jgi:hypothetical protein